MPLGGVDTRYNLSWQEQDKIRRRQELKNHLKQEGITKRYSPYLMMKHDLIQDPAVERYMDLRKRGRLPNTPLKPSIFYGMLMMLAVPIGAMTYIVEQRRKPYLEGCANGDIPYSERINKSMG